MTSLPRHAAPPGAIRILLLLALLWAHPAAARAQLDAGERAANLAANGAVGAVMAGARALIVGKPVWPSVVRGAGGGVVMGAGKQLTMARFSGAGLVARQLSAVGISLAASAGEDTLVLISPLGPVTLEWRPGTGRLLTPRVNVVNAIGLVMTVALEPVRLDVGETISNGALVFRADQIDGGAVDGYQRFGLVVVADDQPEEEIQRLTLPHEMIHLLQEDAWEHLVANPAERALIRRFAPGAAPLLARADLGLLARLSWSAGSLVEYWQQPWEVEAYHLTEGPDWRENYR